MQPLPSPHNSVPEAEEATAYLGRRFAWGGEQLFGLSQKDRRQHTFVLGKSGTGKTTLLRNLLLQDIHAGRGCALIDPHGDMATDLLDHIPPCRADDVALFNPSDIEHPITFNVLADCDADSRHRVAAGIVASLKSIWRDSWGPRLEFILFNAVSALLECENTSLLGLPRLLHDDSYRQWVVRQVKDPLIHGFWADEFAAYDARFRREIVMPIENKIGQLLASLPSRLVLGQVRNRLDIRWMMDHRKIIVANLSKGVIGEGTASLLGAFLISQFYQAAMSRASVAEEERPDFSLVIDEYSNFATDAFASILSEARKFKLSIVLAGQYLDQAPPPITEAVFGNVGTLISFRVGEKDATVLSREFGGHYDPSLYSSLDNHRIVAKLLQDGRYGDPFLAATLPPLDLLHGQSANLIRLSREKYTTPRQDVENKMRRWLGNS